MSDRLQRFGATTTRVLLRYDFGAGACVVDYLGDARPSNDDELRARAREWIEELERSEPERAQAIRDRIANRRALLANARRRLEIEEAAKKKRTMEDA